MERYDLRQVRSMIREIEEDEWRREVCAAYSLFDEDEYRAEYLKEAVRGIADWIGQIEDSQTRRAFRLRYIDGLSWAAVSCRLGYGEESGARKLCERYLENS
nr:hypothetical protein [uncultured Agathobaculum sp.]